MARPVNSGKQLDVILTVSKSDAQIADTILMASYSYGEDANRWASLPPDERICQAVKQVTRIHPQITQEFEAGVSKVWSEDKFAGGAFAFFEPGQEARLYSHMIDLKVRSILQVNMHLQNIVG